MRPSYAVAKGHRPPSIIVDPPDEGDVTVDFAWTGNVSPTTATVKVRSSDASSLTLLYDDNEALSSPASSVGVEGSDGIWTFSLSSLTASTRYYFGFSNATLTGTFKTFPTAGSEASFLIAASSCAGHSGAQYDTVAEDTSDSPAFDKIVAKDPLLFVHTGDRHYRDISSSNVAAFRTAYRDVMRNGTQKNLHRLVPVAYQQSDHDWGGNDTTGSSACKPAFHQVYREHVPHWSVLHSQNIYQTWVIGRTLHILLDCHSDRSPNSQADTAAKTLLGATQKTQFKADLLAATQKVIVVYITTPWIAGGATWEVYPNERQELAEYFEDNDLTSKLILVGGDFHHLSADDGTNTQFDPGSVNPGPIYVGYSPLDAGWTNPQGTYSEGIHRVTHQQYGTIQFTDSGTTITARYRGYAVSGSSESVAFDFTHDFDGT
jgi:phosphodiesterase/alkaline phosphatase D-like protein